MAVRFNGTASNNLRSTAFPWGYNAAYTVIMPITLVVDRDAASTLWAVTDGTNNNADAIRTSATGTLLQANVRIANVGTNAGTFDLVVGRQHLIAAVRESVTAFRLYIDGVLDATNTSDVTSRAAQTQADIGQERGANPVNGRVAWLKVWTIALTRNEILQEMLSVEPVQRTGLYGWWTFPAGSQRTRDYAHGNRHWTQNGTLTDEDVVPTAWRLPRRFVAPIVPAVVAGGQAPRSMHQYRQRRV